MIRRESRQGRWFVGCEANIPCETVFSENSVPDLWSFTGKMNTLHKPVETDGNRYE
jgi:hypothetical protein